MTTPPNDLKIRFIVHKLGPDGRSWTARANVAEYMALASALRPPRTSYTIIAMIFSALSGVVIGFTIGLLWRCP